MSHQTQHARDLFYYQIELIDSKIESKVEATVSKSIDRVIDQLVGLRSEIHDLRLEMITRFFEVETKLSDKINKLDNRLSAVETKLGMKNEVRSRVRNRTIDYSFKAGWLLLATLISIAYLYLQTHR